MPKQIPTIDDPNWGMPLNAHLSQLQNPTNGGINTFEQFSGRPTTLTADDVGKTYIYIPKQETYINGIVQNGKFLMNL